MTDYTTATQRVAAGIRILDARKQCCAPDCGVNENNVVPRDWRSKIKADTLDIASTSLCVLGQIFGDYNGGYDKLGLTGTRGQDYGFAAGYGVGDVYISDMTLTEEWLKQLGVTKTPKYVLEPGLVVKSKLSVAAFKLVRKADGDSYQSHWVVERGSIQDGKFVPAEDEQGRLFYGMSRPDMIMKSYAPVKPVFKKGDVLKDNNGVFYIVDESLSIWKLNTDDGSTYATQDYWETKHGVTFELYTTSGGEPLGDKIN